MPSIRITPATGEIYHVYNRGVEKRDIFTENLDRIRFIHDLFEFNDINPAPDFDRRYNVQNVRGSTPHIKQRPREPIVDILSFCLMDNHYHLLVKQLVDNGLALFMKKLGAGYTVAFNIKNKRVGPLFQGRYKAKHVSSDEYLQHLICYIHLNPLKFLKKVDIRGKIDFAKTWEALNSYRWSSHIDYLGGDNFGSVVEKRFILDLFGGFGGYKEFVQDWIRYENEKLEFISWVAIDME